jgi:hypothetical protein
MREKIDEAENRIKYGQRMHIREPVFVNIRYCKEMNRFTMRGKVQVNRQWLLYCTVHNRGKCVEAYGPMGHGGVKWGERARKRHLCGRRNTVGCIPKNEFWGEDTSSGKQFFCKFNDCMRFGHYAPSGFSRLAVCWTSLGLIKERVKGMLKAVILN